MTTAQPSGLKKRMKKKPAAAVDDGFSIPVVDFSTKMVGNAALKESDIDIFCGLSDEEKGFADTDFATIKGDEYSVKLKIMKARKHFKDNFESDMKKYGEEIDERKKKEKIESGKENQNKEKQKDSASSAIKKSITGFANSGKQFFGAVDSERSDALERIKKIDFSGICEEEPLVNDFFSKVPSLGNVYTKSLETSYEEHLGKVPELSIDAIKAELGLQYIENGEEIVETEENIIKCLHDAFIASRKKKSRDLSIIDVCTTAGITFLSYVVSFVTKGLKTNNFQKLLDAALKEIDHQQLKSALDKNLRDTITEIGTLPQGRSGTVQGIFTLLKRKALSQFIDTITLSPTILAEFYFDDSIIGRQDTTGEGFRIIEQAELSKIVGELRVDNLPELIPMTGASFAARFRTTMNNFTKLQRNAQLAGLTIDQNAEPDVELSEEQVKYLKTSRGYIIDAMRLIGQILTTGKNEFLNLESTWMFITSCAMKPQEHKNFNRFAEIILERKSSISTTSTKFYGFIIDCFSAGLASYILPFLSNDARSSIAMLSNKPLTIRIAHYLIPLSLVPPIFFNDISKEDIEE